MNNLVMVHSSAGDWPGSLPDRGGRRVGQFDGVNDGVPLESDRRLPPARNQERQASSWLASSCGPWPRPRRPGFSRLTAAWNGSTGISMCAQGGPVRGCKSFENGRFQEDRGDRGGIGVTGGSDLLIEGNEAYRNARDDSDADHEIAVAAPQGPVKITRNIIHDCLQGGILIAVSGGGSEISYNLIRGFGTSRYAGPMTSGRFAGTWTFFSLPAASGASEWAAAAWGRWRRTYLAWSGSWTCRGG